MKATPSSLRLIDRVFRVSPSLALAGMPVAAVFLTADVHAQSSSCEQFKAVLAARVDPGIRGFTLDAVPASAPVPPGAKVFGTCDGGATKILFRRGGNTRAGAAVTRASGVASPSPVAAASAVPARVAASASVPGAALKPERVKPAVAPAPAMASATPVAEPVVAEAPYPGDEQVGSWRQRVTDLSSAYWAWLASALLLPLAGVLWAWRTHHRAYDKAGLPRGPRL